MATRTQSRASNRSSTNPSRGATTSRGNANRSAFSWGDGAGPMLAAALAGVAIGLAANYGRKALMQGMEAMAGDWDEILAAEHDMALAIFDKMLATDATQTFKRKHAADEADPRARQACARRKRWSSIRRFAKPMRRPMPTTSKASTAISRPSSTSSTRWVRIRRTGSKRSASSASSSPSMRRWRRNRCSRASSRRWTRSRTTQITSLVNRDGFWMA